MRLYLDFLNYASNIGSQDATSKMYDWRGILTAEWARQSSDIFRVLQVFRALEVHLFVCEVRRRNLYMF